MINAPTNPSQNSAASKKALSVKDMDNAKETFRKWKTDTEETLSLSVIQE